MYIGTKTTHSDSLLYILYSYSVCLLSLVSVSDSIQGDSFKKTEEKQKSGAMLPNCLPIFYGAYIPFRHIVFKDLINTKVSNSKAWKKKQTTFLCNDAVTFQ